MGIQFLRLVYNLLFEVLLIHRFYSFIQQILQSRLLLELMLHFSISLLMFFNSILFFSSYIHFDLFKWEKYLSLWSCTFVFLITLNSLLNFNFFNIYSILFAPFDARYIRPSNISYSTFCWKFLSQCYL
jgi:hypothetical protein